LTIAKELLKETFKYRKDFNVNEPKYQINNWDAGWYQIKVLIKFYNKSRLVKFNIAFKTLEDKMRPLIYELGFLKE
jgi:hypothetical protein